MLSLLNKHAIITGGSRGIGLAIAHRFAAEGAAVTLVGRDEARLLAALDNLPRPPASDGSSSGAHAFEAFDVASAHEWGRLADKLKDSKRPVDILVNAAGVTQNKLLIKGDFSDYQKLVNTNLMGTMYGCATMSKRMIQQKGNRSGCIINISSLLAIKGGRGASAYAASKAGIIGLTRSLASEVGQFGIRVNVLLPGYIQTKMTQSEFSSPLAPNHGTCRPPFQSSLPRLLT